MNRIESTLAPMPENIASSRGKNPDEATSSSPPLMFQLLLASVSEGTMQKDSEKATTSLESEDEAFQNEGEADESQTRLLTPAWLQTLLSGELTGDVKNLSIVNTMSGVQQKNVVLETGHMIQDEMTHSDNKNAGKTQQLKALTNQALTILEMLLNHSNLNPTGERPAQTDAKHTDKQVAQSAAKLLQLLKQHEQLMQQNSAPAAKQEQTISESNPVTQEATLWTSLLSAYDKRSQLKARQQYDQAASISTRDVVKWLKQALMRKDGMQTADSSHVLRADFDSKTGAMSKVEQFVLHVQQNTNNTPDKALIDQFQKAIQSSRLFGQHDNATRLNFSLRPQSLGDITVKLAQVNGDMTVKILVSSASAQDMMEKNIHQLKHIFSPHHVTIERQDNQVAQTQDVYAREEEDTHQEQGGDEPSEEDDGNQQQDDSETFEKELSALLNLKV